jgi:hypothetical protein
MLQYTTDQLQPRDLILYRDICISSGVIPYMSHLTRRQIELLISIRGVVAPYTEIRTKTRLWKVL